MIWQILVALIVGFVLITRIIDEIITRRNHKRLIRVLKDGSPLLEKLTREIEKRKITLVPLGSSIEKFLCNNFRGGIPSIYSLTPVFLRSKIEKLLLGIFVGWQPKIVLPEQRIKELITQKLYIGQIELFLSHEIGHHLVHKSEGLPGCRIIKERLFQSEMLNCFYDELRAYEEGLKLIDRIFGLKNWQVEIQGKEISKNELDEYILNLIKKQCFACLSIIDRQPERCLKYQEVFEVRKRIWRLLN